MDNQEKLVRFMITLIISGVGLYFKIKAAKVNGIYKRITKGADERASVPELVVVRRKSATLQANEWQSTAASYELVRGSTLSKLPNIDTQVRFYDLFHHLADWYLFTKNILICLLRHKALARLRYLDCFMLGRFIANGRAIELTPYCACYETIVWLIWRYVMLRQTPEFRLPCIEFLLDKQCHESFWLRRESMDAGDNEYHSVLLEYQNPFEMYPEKLACESTARKPPFRLRPNRTREAWHELARATLIYHAISTSMFIGALGHFLSMGLPVAITRRGFTLNYRLCIQSLVESSASATHSHGYFLGNDTAMFARPQIVRDFFMPYTDFVIFNFYHIFRITIEVLETLFFYVEVCLSFNYGLFITIIMSKDVLCYSQAIVVRMKGLTEYLRRQRGSRQWELYDPKGRNRISYSGTRDDVQFIRTETLDIQAQISDMFTMLDSYNKYVSLQCLCFLIFWLGYSAMVSSWIFLPGNDSPKLEWYVLLCAGTLYLLIMLNFMTRVKTSCHKLYNLISVAMALGDGDRCERDVWISLMGYYKPRPMYCFTMLGSIELTYLSGLKSLIWLFSALIIASSFFKVHIIE